MKMFTLFLILPSLCFASREAEERAKDAIVTAFYKQSGIEDNVNNYIQKYVLPEKHKDLIGNVGIVINTIVSKKVEAKWQF